MASYEKLLDGLIDSKKTSVKDYFDFRDNVRYSYSLPKEQDTKVMLKEHYDFENEMKLKCKLNDTQH